MKGKKALRQLFDGGYRKTNERSLNRESVKRASEHKKMYRTASVLACIVAFATTYMLILPAITVEKDDVIDQLAGVTVSEPAEGIGTDAVAETAGEDAALGAAGSVDPEDAKDLEAGELVLITGEDSTDPKAHVGIVVEAVEGSESGQTYSVIEKDPEKGVVLTEVSLEDPTVTILSPEEAVEYPELGAEVTGLISAAQEEEILGAEEAAELEGEVENSLAALGVDAEEDSSTVGENDEGVIQSEGEDSEEESAVTEEDSSVQAVQDDNGAEEQNDDAVIPDEVKDPEDAKDLEEQTAETGIITELDNDIATTTYQVANYLLSYTVDFHWDVEGKNYEYNLPGGGFISLTELIETLGVVGDDGPTSLESRALIANIEKVEFSSPELLSVSKAEEETTVGAIKDALGLECEYSNELTEEDIDRIDATIVQKGDWALISLKPFDTEESLIVTMKNGIIFEILVTDVAYQGTKITDPNGKTVALLNLTNNNALQSTAHSTNGRLQATDIQLDGNRVTSQDLLATWTFTLVPDTVDRYYIHASNGYLNINEDGLVFVTNQPQELMVQQDDSGRIRIKHVSNVNAINNNANRTTNGYGTWDGNTWPNNEGYQNPGEWFTMYEIGAPNVPHVTVHYVLRDGTELKDVQYTGENPLIVKNADGTFMIPYDWGNAQTFGTSVDLRVQFFKEGYTYANTHLGGTDASGNRLTYEGYMIDASLVSNGSDLFFAADTGRTNKRWDEPDSVLGNRQYGSLKLYSLSSVVNASPSNNGQPMVYSSSSNKDIYVVLDPIPSSSSSGGNNVNPEEVANPSLEKTMKPNNDGTYTLSLKVDAHATNAADTNKANVLFVVDTSSSMRSTTTSNSRNRIMDTHDAVLGLGEKLLQYNNAHPGAVEVSMITFDGGVNERLDWTTETSDFQNAVNDYLRYYYLHTGTDWEDGMKEALKKLQEDTDDDPTFVVFFTDGEPSQYSNFHGAGTNTNSDPTGTNTSGQEQISGSYPNFYSYFLSREASKDEMRAIVNTGAQLYGIYAYNTTNEYYDGYNGHEDGAKMLHNAIKYGYNTDADLTNNLFYEARNTNDLKGAFDKIFNLITESVGFSNVVVNDGIAAGVTSSTVVDGDVSGFTYTIKDKAGNLAYKVTVAPNGVPEGDSVADGTPLFWLSESGPPVIGQKKTVSTKKIKTGTDGNPVLDSNENIQTEEVSVEVYYFKDANDKEYIMPISTTGENIKWDLSPLGILKDGYSYEVSFIVWPNQDSYDLVADLNNGKLPDLEASANWSNQPIKTDSAGRQYRKGGFTQYPYISRYEETGIYSAMSNTDQSIDYYKIDKKIENGEEVTKITGPHTTTVDPPDPMPLTASYSHIEKVWNVERDPGILAQYLYETDGTSKQFHVDFDIFQGTDTVPYTTASLGWDSSANNYVWAEGSPITSVTYAGHQYNIGTRWAKDFSIATGLMLSDTRMEELGLNKSHYPSAKYNNKTYYILEEGHDYTIKEHQTGTIGYEFDFSAPVYHPMLVDGVLQSVEMDVTKDNDGKIQSVTINSITNSEEGLSSLQIKNTLRGYIHLNKKVVDKDGNQVPDDSKFKYTITLNNEGAPFEGKDIPWFGINGLFYHDEDYNYYQAYPSGSGQLSLRTEDEKTYNATCEGTFDPDIVGPTTVTYMEENGEPKTIQLYGNQASVSNDKKTATATMKISQTVVLNLANVPVGTTYSISETQTRGYELVKVEREIMNGNDQESYEDLSGSISSGQITGTITANRDNHIIYSNRRDAADLEIYKVDEESLDSDVKTYLKNAKFTITQLDETGEGNYKTDPESTETPKALYYQETFITDDNGKVVIEGLASGYYELKETVPPAGYNLSAQPVYIKVESGIITRISKTTDDSETQDVNEGLIVNWPENDDATGLFRFTETKVAIRDDPETDEDEIQEAQTAMLLVGNTPGAALPSTGGPGTEGFLVVGGVLVIGAAAALLRRKLRA